MINEDILKCIFVQNIVEYVIYRDNMLFIEIINKKCKNYNKLKLKNN